MSRLTWGAAGERVFEAGVDRGVLYIGSEAGVPWNGLVSINETTSGGEIKSYYLDGLKYLDRVLQEEFEATLEAYTYPDEFAKCDGTQLVRRGLFATQQPRKKFNLIYRSKIGNDVDGLDFGYKIHIVYDAVAAPTARNNKTLQSSASPNNFSWKIAAKPPRLPGFRPTAHFVIDSRETPAPLLQQIEDILYGTDEEAPRLPSIAELYYLFDIYETSAFDAGIVPAPYWATFDASTPGATYTTTIDGGVP